MDRDKVKERDVPYEDKAARKEGDKNRRELDEIPEHGTDPLHEGP